MGKLVDLTGRTFGRLTVIERAPRKGKRTAAVWRCNCTCGATTDVVAYSLSNGVTRSCGCLNKEAASSRFAKNITGTRSGLLEAVRPTGGRRDRKILWLCRCDCGKSKLVSASDFISQNAISCGCAGTGAGLRPKTVRADKSGRNNARRTQVTSAGGRFAETHILAILARQGCLCADPRCRVPLDEKSLRRDHKESVRRGGTSWPRNMQCLCARCNGRKGAKPYLQWVLESRAGARVEIPARRSAVLIVNPTGFDRPAPADRAKMMARKVDSVVLGMPAPADDTDELPNIPPAMIAAVASSRQLAFAF